MLCLRTADLQTAKKCPPRAWASRAEARAAAAGSHLIGSCHGPSATRERATTTTSIMLYRSLKKGLTARRVRSGSEPRNWDDDGDEGVAAPPRPKARFHSAAEHARLLQDMGSETQPASRSRHLQARQFSARIQRRICSQRWQAAYYVPEPVGQCVDDQLRRKATQEKEVKRVEHLAHIGWTVVFIEEHPVELCLGDSEGEILISKTSQIYQQRYISKSKIMYRKKEH